MLSRMDRKDREPFSHLGDLNRPQGRLAGLRYDLKKLKDKLTTEVKRVKVGLEFSVVSLIVVILSVCAVAPQSVGIALLSTLFIAGIIYDLSSMETNRQREEFPLRRRMLYGIRFLLLGVLLAVGLPVLLSLVWATLPAPLGSILGLVMLLLASAVIVCAIALGMVSHFKSIPPLGYKRQS